MFSIDSAASVSTLLWKSLSLPGHSLWTVAALSVGLPCSFCDSVCRDWVSSFLMICSSSLSQVTTSQNCVKLLFDVIKLAVRFQKDVSEAWIKVRYMLQSWFPHLFGLLGWAQAFFVIKCGIKRQMLALHFTDKDFILQERKNLYPYIESELCVALRCLKMSC